MDKIQEIYASYGDIINEVGVDKVRQRFMDLNQAYVDFINNENISEKVTINSFMNSFNYGLFYRYLQIKTKSGI